MGEVYRARDTKLRRDVALKILPSPFAVDRERQARFAREAHVLATLNHPNIAAIYGVEESTTASGLNEPVTALVLELVEGTTLAERIATGPLPITEALQIALQTADALDAAHQNGIVHRDLKPANIKVTDDGRVKVLDFGLAKATPQEATGDVLASTVTAIASRAGVLLGTVAYMSPEQATGKPVDKRADIWAFGCVVFEMLTGRAAFSGETTSDYIVAILERAPDWAALRGAVSANVRRLLLRCLEKDPRRRLHDIADARIEIEDALAPQAETSRVTESRAGARSLSRVRHMAMVAVIAAALGALAVWLVARPAGPVPAPDVTRFPFPLPPDYPIAASINDRDLALSADARRLVYTAGTESQLITRAFDQLDPTPLAGVVNARAPFFSPDGRWVAFFDRLDEGVSTGALREVSLRKVSLAGGSPVEICRIVGGSRGASWGDDDTIIFATSDPGTGLMRVSARGGQQPTVLTTPDRPQRDHHFPSILPGGVGVLLTIEAGGLERAPDVALFEASTGRTKILIPGGSQASYIEPGYVVYVVDGTLWAVRFDLSTLEVIGEPVPVVDRVMTSYAANFSVSPGGTLAYVSGTADTLRSLVWVGHDGRQEPVPAPIRGYTMVRLSPDGKRVAIGTSGASQQYVISTWDFSEQTTFTRLTFAELSSNATWASDGRYIIYSAGPITERGLFRRLFDGTGREETLRLRSGENNRPTSVLPDGTRVVFEQRTLDAGFNIMLLNLDGRGREEPLLTGRFDERNGTISPDGRWIAYDSNESGPTQVYVRPFPNVNDGQYQISSAGGRSPLWARSGRELFFVNGTSLMAAPMELTPAFKASQASRLFGDPSLVLDGRFTPAGSTIRPFDVAPDGRFLMIKAAEERSGAAGTSIVVVRNWREELKAMLRSAK